MKRIKSLSIFLFALLLLNFAACNSFKAKMEVKKGNEFYAAKQFDQAIERYKKALSLAPNLYTIYENIGLAYMAEYVPGSTHPKDVQYALNAIWAFNEFLKHEPDNAQVKEFLITMYLNADRKGDAAKYFESELQKKPDDTQTMQKLAFLYAQMGPDHFEDALKWYQRRASVDPKPEAYYIIGVICWEKSYKTQDITPEERERLVKIGMDNLEKAIKINPIYADAYLYENLLLREKAKLIAPDPNNVPEERVDEYNALLAKAKELQDKYIELRKKNATS